MLPFSVYLRLFETRLMRIRRRAAASTAAIHWSHGSSICADSSGRGAFLPLTECIRLLRVYTRLIVSDTMRHRSMASWCVGAIPFVCRLSIFPKERTASRMSFKVMPQTSAVSSNGATSLCLSGESTSCSSSSCERRPYSGVRTDRCCEQEAYHTRRRTDTRG
jgi:hypothetical protein